METQAQPTAEAQAFAPVYGVPDERFELSVKTLPILVDLDKPQTDDTPVEEAS